MEADRGLVFDIHRGTTHDGPGMRTTVFFKGCPLRCGWCQNPESLSYRQEAQWTKSKCIGCGLCAAACARRAISFGPEGLEIDDGACERCFSCARACPSGALGLSGRWWEKEDLLREALKDDIFFAEFKGGVTLSGGEPLAQYAFAAGFLKALKERGTHTALDTSGCAPLAAFEAVYPFTDLFLFDIKLISEPLHKKHTGAGNRLILDNLRWLASQGPDDKEIWIRTPLIPGATADEENIAGIGKFLAGLPAGKIKRWELCAFNNVCRGKYEKMRLDWAYRKTPLMTAGETEGLLAAAREYAGGRAVLTGLTAKDG